MSGRQTRRGLVAVLAIIGVAFVTAANAEDVVFDARGFQQNRPYFSQLPYEHIDPLTGNLVLTFTDLVLPGNANFDLKIQRAYNSKIYGDPVTHALAEDSWAGVGWTLHMGRVIDPYSAHPIIEMPDGSRHPLYRRLEQTNAFRTREHWSYDPRFEELILPNGVYIKFRFAGAPTLPGGQPVLYATSINDLHGNEIAISYKTGAGIPRGAIDTIVQTVGNGQEKRTVKFEVDTVSGALTTMTLQDPGSQSGRTWTYTQVGTGQIKYNLLTQVTPPVGTPWRYSYETSSFPKFELIGINTPSGGEIAFSYQDQRFQLGTTHEVDSRVVARRETRGRDITQGLWEYQYAYGLAKNQTVITGC